MCEALAAETEAKIAEVTIVGGDRIFVLGGAGVEADQGPREHSLCNYPVATGEVFVVEDAPQDARVSDHPKVTGEPHIRFYVGIPLSVGETVVGTVCAFGWEARELEWHSRSAVFRLVGLLERLLETRVRRGPLPRRSFALLRHLAKAEADAIRLDCTDGLQPGPRRRIEGIRNALYDAEQVLLDEGFVREE